MPPSPGVRLSRCCAYQGSFRKSSKSVVNSLSISAKVPVFQGFAEIIKVVSQKTFKFCRNSINANAVWKCNDSYEKIEEIRLSDYCKWLDSKYAISLPELSFRDAVGRYIRVYGKNNCDERRPLHYQATEKTEKACTALLKLFDAYSSLKETAVAAQHSNDELTAYKKAQALQFIAKITKRVYEKNEKDIRSIAAQIGAVDKVPPNRSKYGIIRAGGARKCS